MMFFLVMIFNFGIGVLLVFLDEVIGGCDNVGFGILLFVINVLVISILLGEIIKDIIF